MRRLQRLRQRSVHPVSHWWETIQPAKTPSQGLSVRGHPTEVPLRRRLYTGCTLSRSRRRFWLTVSLGKTEAMFQPSPSQTANAPPPPPIVINNIEITGDCGQVLGSTVKSSGSLGAGVMQRFGKASAAHPAAEAVSPTMSAEELQHQAAGQCPTSRSWRSAAYPVLSAGSLSAS